MVVQTKLNILNALDLNPSGVHLRKLSEEVNGSFPNVRRFVNLLVKEGVIKTEHQGNLLNIKLKESFSTLAYLKFVHTFRFLELPESVSENIQFILENLEQKPLICLIFGSYAEQKKDFKKDPLEILFVFQNIKNKKVLSENIKKLSKNKEINTFLIDYSFFKKNLFNKDNDLFNKIKKNNILIIGVDYYYNLLWRNLK